VSRRSQLSREASWELSNKSNRSTSLLPLEREKFGGKGKGAHCFPAQCLREEGPFSEGGNCSKRVEREGASSLFREEKNDLSERRKNARLPSRAEKGCTAAGKGRSHKGGGSARPFAARGKKDKSAEKKRPSRNEETAKRRGGEI